ncbi:hypothetical protein F4813DRAFT_398471 [Daldinia decipiens]|uniref:uncharacterized protein n=1 Tax=Daldinia decipiens TaxID=326647 RepID=UPI0020C55F78|nr:uncharacterized protein F4813DRAFT_398471 [Daldinia decipiens]KAI1655344.1 hypothetical protein F4813DRAFT_398471 [Daldinia decipiens]
MSNKTAKSATAGNGDSTKWSSDESANLLLLIMQEENKELAVKGWKAIGEKAKEVFDGKYTVPALKHQFQKLRNRYLGDFPTPQEDSQAGSEAAKTPTKGRKRKAASMDGPDAESDTGTKAKKAPVAKKTTKRTKSAAEDAMQDDYLGDSDGGEQKPAKATKRRVMKKSNVKAADDESDDGHEDIETPTKPKPKTSRASQAQKKSAIDSEEAEMAAKLASDAEDNIQAGHVGTAPKNDADAMQTDF